MFLTEFTSPYSLNTKRGWHTSELRDVTFPLTCRWTYDCSWLRHHLTDNHHRCCSFQIPTAVTMAATSASSRQSSIWPRALPSPSTRRAVRRVLRFIANSSSTYRCAPRSVGCATPTPRTITKGTPSRTLLMAPPAGGRAPVFKTGRNMSGSQ